MKFRNPILMASLFFLLCANALLAASNDEIKQKIKELKRKESRGEKTVLDEKLIAVFSRFIEANRDISMKDYEKFRLTSGASVIMYEELSNRYGVHTADDASKIKPLREQGLYRMTLEINKKDALRPYLFCVNNNETEARKLAQRSWELRQEASKKERGSDEYLKVYEQVLDQCKYDGTVIWELLSTYRYKKYRQKYNDLMLRIIKEDQVDYDYSSSVENDIDGQFKNEYLQFFSNVNSLYDKLLLTKDQVRIVGEAALTKHKAAFNVSTAVDVERALDTVLAMVVLSTWLDYYKHDDVRAKFLKENFNAEIVRETLRVYSDVKGFKQHFDYLNPGALK